jgi:hypothetical protein
VAKANAIWDGPSSFSHENAAHRKYCQSGWKPFVGRTPS